MLAHAIDFPPAVQADVGRVGIVEQLVVKSTCSYVSDSGSTACGSSGDEDASTIAPSVSSIAPSVSSSALSHTNEAPSSPGHSTTVLSTCIEHATEIELPTPATRTSFLCAYRLLGDRPLGAGRFGQVWRCRAYGETNETADKAVKRIKTGVLSAVGRKRIYDEVAIHSTLTHPHIVALHDVYGDCTGRPNELASLVLELCLGSDLFERVTSTRQRTGRGLPECDAAIVLHQILLAIDFLHNHQIVHRDIRCENVLLLQQDQPIQKTSFKLCDFGCAAVLPEGGTLCECIGAPSTAAPEVLSGKPYSFWVDMWSTGVVLYMVLSASSPFVAKSRQLIPEVVKSGKFSFVGKPWCGVSQPAKELVCKFLEMDTSKRSTASSALQNAWLTNSISTHFPDAPSGQAVCSRTSDCQGSKFTRVVEHLAIEQSDRSKERRQKTSHAPSSQKIEEDRQRDVELCHGCLSSCMHGLSAMMK